MTRVFFIVILRFSNAVQFLWAWLTAYQFQAVVYLYLSVLASVMLYMRFCCMCQKCLYSSIGTSVCCDFNRLLMLQACNDAIYCGSVMTNTMQLNL